MHPYFVHSARGDAELLAAAQAQQRAVVEDLELALVESQMDQVAGILRQAEAVDAFQAFVDLYQQLTLFRRGKAQIVQGLVLAVARLANDRDGFGQLDDLRVHLIALCHS